MVIRKIIKLRLHSPAESHGNGRPGFLGFLLLVLISIGATSRAQNISLEAAVSQNEVLVGETLDYTLEVGSYDNSSLPAAELPDFSPFIVLGSNQSEQTHIVSIGARQTTKRGRTYTVRIQAPMKDGVFTIPAARAGGIESKPLQIRVRDDSATLPSLMREENLRFAYTRPTHSTIDRRLRGNLFVQPVVEATDVYKRQPVQVTWYLYLAQNLSVQRLNLTNFDWEFYKSGNTDDFFFRKVFDANNDQVQRENVTIDGEAYTRLRLSTLAVYPLKEGKLTVPHFAVSCSFSTDQRSPFFSFGMGPQVIAPSKPVELNVMPLPTNGRPDGFTGVVGSYSMEVEADRTQAVQGEDFITLKAKVRGRGYADTLPPPIFPDMPDFTVFQQARELSTEWILTADEEHAVGTRSWEIILRPEKPGKREIPPLTFAFFDPWEETYRVLRSDPIPIEIERSEKYAELQAARERGEQPQKPEPEIPAGSDYQFIETAPLDGHSAILTPTVYRRWLTTLGVVGLLFLGSFLIQPARARNTALDRHSRALREALRGLKHAEARGNGDTVLDAIDSALRGYIADKIDRQPDGLEPRSVADAIIEHTGSEELSRRAESMLEESAAARYASGSSTMEPSIEDARKLLEALESEWRGGPGGENA